MAAQKEKEQRFDQVKLQAMHEPLTVRVEKMRGNVRQPIELPAKGNEQTGFNPPGTNWTRDEVLQLENFILTKWAGGGYYEFTVNDAKGDRMIWQGVWDPRLYPEKIPPNTAEAALVNAATSAQQVTGPQIVPVSAQPLGSQQTTGWPPSSNALGYNNPPHTGPVMPTPPTPVPQVQSAVPAPAPQAPPMWATAPQQGPWFGSPTQQPGPWGAQPYGYVPGYPPPAPYPYGGRSRFSNYDDDDRDSRRRLRVFDQDDSEKKELERRHETERKELEKRLQQLEIERKETEYKVQLERQQQAHEQQMAAMREEIRRLGEARPKGEDEEVRRMREERERERERMAAEQAAMQRQIQEQQLLQMRQDHERSMAAMREEMARMNASRGDNEALMRIREEQERQRQEFDRQRADDQRRLELERAERERERERYEQQRRDEMLQRELKETREASDRRFEQLAAQGRQTDPVVEMMKENARNSAENMREIARMQAESTNRMAQFMVSPVQVAQMMKENNNGTDGVIRNIIGSVAEIGGLYKNAAETIMQMSGGGGDPPAARLIQEGLARGSEVAERFLAVKRDQVISEGKVKQAEAQRDATRIQAEAALRSQAMAAQQAAMHARPTGQQWSPPPPVAQSGGLNGAPNGAPNSAPNGTPNGAPSSAGAPRPQSGVSGPQNGVGAPVEGQVQVVARPPKTPGPIDVEVVPPPPAPKAGPTEEEMFGIALESVHRLRRGVAEGKLDPNKTIDAILQGVEHVVSNNLIIPAFTLFQQERWADFIDVMLPNAPGEFKAECVRILIEEIEPGDPNEPADGADASAAS